MTGPIPLEALVLAALAGAAIPAGGALARWERFLPRWREREFRHTVIAFGGGALLGAVALVLVPEGIRHLPPVSALAGFAAGGLAFMALDRAVVKAYGEAGQLLAMLVDFVPEAIALGALFAAGGSAGPLLALLIALQNLPEAFNAYNELTAHTPRPKGVLARFGAIALLGPAAVAAGYYWLAHSPAALGALMLFAAGGILYIVFQDIAPKAPYRNHWGPPLGAVGGFALALAGDLVIG